MTFEIAERLHRTVKELRYGTTAEQPLRPLSEYEFAGWQALYQLRAEEASQRKP